MTDHCTLDAIAKAEARSFYLTEEHHPEDGTMLGFWLYLMSDCLVFAVPVRDLRRAGPQLRGGPSGADLFELPLVAVNTSLLLLSSITYGFAMLEMQRNKPAARRWSGWRSPACSARASSASSSYEFAHLIHEGAGPQRSAFLSSFFTLVGTHGLHVTFGIVWLVTLMVQVAQARPDRRRTSAA